MLRGVVAFGPYWRGGAQKSTAPFGSGSEGLPCPSCHAPDLVKVGQSKLTARHDPACDKAKPVTPVTDHAMQKRKDNRHLPHCRIF